MNIFPKKYSTKKLNIREMWQLYILLNTSDKSEEYLIQETVKMLDGISTEDFKKSLEIMCGNKQPKTPSQAALWFVDGLKKSEFFSFRSFISGFINGNR